MDSDHTWYILRFGWKKKRKDFAGLGTVFKLSHHATRSVQNERFLQFIWKSDRWILSDHTSMERGKKWSTVADLDPIFKVTGDIRMSKCMQYADKSSLLWQTGLGGGGGISFPLNTVLIIVWAASWQNQQSDCAPSEDSDQPGHPPSLIRVFAVRSVCS